MASQLSVVGGNRRLKRNQTAELNARQALLPQIIANKQRAEDLGRAEEMKNIQISQFNRQHALNLQGQAAQRRAGEVGMGLEAAKLGMTVKDRFGGGKSPMFGGSSFGKKAGSFMNNMKFGEAVGGGLAGFGAAKMLGGKSKIKKALIGGGVGAAMGFLGGGGGGGALSGGFGGAFGGLFG